MSVLVFMSASAHWSTSLLEACESDPILECILMMGCGMQRGPRELLEPKSQIGPTSKLLRTTQCDCMGASASLLQAKPRDLRSRAWGEGWKTGSLVSFCTTFCLVWLVSVSICLISTLLDVDSVQMCVHF